MKEFTVRRSKWVRGDGINGDARLLNSNNCMCCLGFAICQITKMPQEELMDKRMPSHVFTRKSFLTETTQRLTGGSFVSDNELANDASLINDNSVITDAVRETELKKIFRKHGIKINFKD